MVVTSAAAVRDCHGPLHGPRNDISKMGGVVEWLGATTAIGRDCHGFLRKPRNDTLKRDAAMTVRQSCPRDDN